MATLDTMKASMLLPAGALMAMVSCDTMNAPLSDGGFDPLRTPGSESSGGGGTQGVRPGQFVVATIDNTAFFSQRPGAEADADKLLSRGTSMKVISTSGSYYRVELDSGEVGFVPTVMVEDPDAMADDLSTPFELYPPGFDVEPLPLPEDIPTEPLPDVIEPEPATEPSVEPEPSVGPEPSVEPEPTPETVPDEAATAEPSEE